MNWNKIEKEFLDKCVYLDSSSTTTYTKYIHKLTPYGIVQWFKKKYKPKRRGTKANALYWVWMQCLEEETGQNKNDYHDYFKDKFIGYSIKEFNERSIIKEPSTRGMLKKPFNDYMKKVQAECSTEFGITVPLPEDQGYDQFIEHYKDYL